MSKATRRAAVQVNIRLTQEEAERIRREAERQSATVSELIRAAAMKLVQPATSGSQTGAA